MKPFAKTHRGFTLIELLVVVMILGILVSVALGSYISAAKTAKQNAAESNARAIASAVGSTFVKANAYPLSLNDTAVVGDMGGSIPNNPCSADLGAGGYEYASVSGGVTITAKADGCGSYSPSTFAVKF